MPTPKAYYELHSNSSGNIYPISNDEIAPSSELNTAALVRLIQRVTEEEGTIPVSFVMYLHEKLILAFHFGDMIYDKVNFDEELETMFSTTFINPKELN